MCSGDIYLGGPVQAQQRGVVARRGLDVSIGPRVQRVGEVGVDGHLVTTLYRGTQNTMMIPW